MKAIIVDDEPKAVSVLSWELSKFSDYVDVVATYNDASSAIDALKHNNIDIVFLDIKMPGLSGMDLLSVFPHDRDFAVILTTAHGSYALEALKNEVVDYLLKPIDEEDLYQSILKASRFVKLRKQYAFRSSVGTTMHNNKKLKLYHDGEILLVDMHDVLCCESNGNYTRVHLTDRKLFITKQLKEFEETLPSSKFFRIHKSYLVQLDKIVSFSKQESSVTLCDGSQFPVSRDRKQEFLKSIF